MKRRQNLFSHTRETLLNVTSHRMHDFLHRKWFRFFFLVSLYFSSSFCFGFTSICVYYVFNRSLLYVFSVEGGWKRRETLRINNLFPFFVDLLRDPFTGSKKKDGKSEMNFMFAFIDFKLEPWKVKSMRNWTKKSADRKEGS